MNAITPIDNGAKVESALSSFSIASALLSCATAPLRSPRGAAIS